MSCKICSKVGRKIVWKDYERKVGSIDVCIECAVWMNWQEGISAYQENLPNMINCIECKDKFIPKKTDQTKCSDCWVKFFRQRENHKQIQVTLW